VGFGGGSRLSPETVRIKGKCASEELSQVAADDATDADSRKGEMTAVESPTAIWMPQRDTV
jgi:hypothetical protein